MRTRLLSAVLATLLGLGLVACSDAADDPVDGTDPAIETDSGANEGGLPPTDDALGTDPLGGDTTDDGMADDTMTEGG